MLGDDSHEEEQKETQPGEFEDREPVEGEKERSGSKYLQGTF